jgi:hypothetical protein
VSILILVRQAWRRSLGWWAVLLAAAATASAFAAAETGEMLAEVVGEPLRHASLGDGLPYFAAAMFVMVTVYVAAGAFVDWRRSRQRGQRPLTQGAVPAASVVPAATTTIEDPSVAEDTAIPPVPPSSAPSTLRPPRKVPLVVTILGILAVVVAGLATIQTFRVGESGAQAVWGAELAAAQASPSAEATKVIPMSEVTLHATGKDCWTVINGTVYDLTAWVSEHPGGSGPIMTLCGTDGTNSFTTQHGGQARPEAELAGFEIGTVK